MSVTKELMDPIDFHVSPHTMEVSRVFKTYYVFSRKKKSIQVWRSVCCLLSVRCASALV